MFCEKHLFIEKLNRFNESKSKDASFSVPLIGGVAQKFFDFEKVFRRSKKVEEHRFNLSDLIPQHYLRSCQPAGCTLLFLYF